MASPDLSRCMVMVGAFDVLIKDKELKAKRLKAIAEHNSEFRFDPYIHDADGTGAWMGNNVREELHGAIFALPLEPTRMPKNNSTYILGSLDPEEAAQAAKSHPGRRTKDGCACDFELAVDNHTGISRKSLSIDLYPQPNADKQVTVRVAALADGVWCATAEADPDAGWSTTKMMKKGSHIEVPKDGSLLITISWVEFRLWVPRLTPKQDARRRRLAYEFARETHRNPLTYLPNIHVGVDTRYDDMRIGASDNKAMYMQIGGADHSESKAATPFFSVWSPPNILLSAWQPKVDGDCPRTVAEFLVNKVEMYFELSQLLPQHPNIFHVRDVGIYAADDCRYKPGNLPWAITEHVPDKTQTLAALFDLEAAGETPLTATQRLSIFQQTCSGMSHLHANKVAHGDFDSCDIFIVSAAAAAGDEPGKASDRAVLLHNDPDCTVKMLPFTMSPLSGDDRDLAKAKKDDAIKLGRLGVRLLAGRDALAIKPDSDDEAWIAASYGIDYRVQPLVENLICGRFTSESAKFWMTGVIVDKPAVTALAKSMEKRSSKRKRIESRLSPEESVRWSRAMVDRNRTPDYDYLAEEEPTQVSDDPDAQDSSEDHVDANTESEQSPVDAREPSDFDPEEKVQSEHMSTMAEEIDEADSYDEVKLSPQQQPYVNGSSNHGQGYDDEIKEDCDVDHRQRRWVRERGPPAADR